MSTNTLLKVEGSAWSVCEDIEKSISHMTTSHEIIDSLGLDFTVSPHQLKTDIEEPVPNFFAIYRDDNQKMLGAVNSSNIQLVQPRDTFQVFEPLMQEGILSPVVCDTYRGGKVLFGTFKFNDEFMVGDDSFSQYFVAINEFTRPDGQLQILNTPIRMSCMNAYNSALNRSTMRFKIPAYLENGDSSIILNTILNAFEASNSQLKSFADRMLSTKVSHIGIEKIKDELFPFMETTEEEGTHERANQSIEAQRAAFDSCLNADNIANYQGTMYAVWNAVTDYSQHYFTKPEKAFDLSHRMTQIQGFDPEASTNLLKVTKFLKTYKKFESKPRKKVA